MTHTNPSINPLLKHGPETAITLALTLAEAERAIHEFTSEQVDAIVDADGKAYLLRPAQEHLRQNGRRLQLIIDSAADVITVVNRGGIILSTSRAVRRVLGYAPEELVGKSIFDFIHEDDLSAAHFAYFGVIEFFRENATVQFRHLARDGFWRMIEASVGILHETSSVSVVFVLRPIGGSSRPHPEPAAIDLLQADDDRECILLSHGRRIPRRAIGLGLDA